MALALPKINIPKLALSKKQIPLVVGGVVVLAALGWFGWQYFEDSAPPPAVPAKPQAVTAAKAPAAAKAAAPVDAGKLIEDVLAASGLKQQLNQLPQKLTAGVRQSGTPKTSPAVLKAIENSVAESFSAKGFYDRVSAGLQKKFDATRLQALLKDYSTPAAKRMVALEQASAAQEELAQFTRSAAATKPSPKRTQLIKRIDAATRASDLAIELAFSSMKAVALGAAGGGAKKAAAVDKAIEKQRASATDNIRNATALNLAFSYRSASDDELEQYAEFYETENSKWFSGIVYTSLVEGVQATSAKAGEHAAAPVDKPAPPAAKPAGSKAGMDARACLDLATNKAIMSCAEEYR